MTNVAVTTVDLGPRRPGRPLLVVGPSLGTSVADLWGPCAALLADRVDVVGWDLPGHGTGHPTQDPFTVEDLADAVAAIAADLLADRDAVAVHYAGDSVGGAVGLALLLRHPGLVTSATLACTGARIGTSDGWADRAALVRTDGIDAVVPGSLERWFGPGFRDREPETVDSLIGSLRACDAESYARVCEALGAFDVRDDLGRITTALRLVAGREDVATPVDGMELIAGRVPGARLTVLQGVGHLAPIEAPVAVADEITAGVLDAT
ncbi:alpha/beta fold hydrolase [Williamsia sp. MIQD14]|uniref:alpha/beta fold hydrolase n=1 Tax=Williamsia sp. MIQD14 TaxID=3425703 RepID=UPI003DA1AD99